MARALIVVDVQRDFCEGGSLAVKGGNKVAVDINQYLAEFASDYDITMASQDWHIDPGSHFSDDPDFVDSWPKHCVPGTEGALLHRSLGGFPFTYRFYKGQFTGAYSAFEGYQSYAGHGRKLNDILKGEGITSVDVVGLAFDYCVKATAIDAADHGYLTTVLTPFTAAVRNDEDSVRKTIKELQSKGVRVT